MLYVFAIEYYSAIKMNEVMPFAATWMDLEITIYGFPCGMGVIRDMGLIPGLGRSPGEEHGNPLQYSCLGNSVDRGAWQATVHGVAKSQTRKE